MESGCLIRRKYHRYPTVHEFLFGTRGVKAIGAFCASGEESSNLGVCVQCLRDLTLIIHSTTCTSTSSKTLQMEWITQLTGSSLEVTKDVGSFQMTKGQTKELVMATMENVGECRQFCASQRSEVDLSEPVLCLCWKKAPTSSAT